MGYFDDIVPPDTASSYVATPLGVPRITVRPSPDQVRGRLFETGAARSPQDEGVEPPGSPQPDDMPADLGHAPSPRATGLFDDIVAPAMRVRPAGLPFGDSDEIVGQAPAPGKPVFFHDDDPIADNAARAGELAWHKAAIESALSNTVPLRLQHSRPVEIAAGLMADHGMPLDEALDRATMRFHAEDGTAEAGKISDVIGKDAFDEAQRAPASPYLAQAAQGVGQGRAAAEEQAEARAPITNYVGDPVKTHPNDKAGEADNAARAGELAWHKAAIESALSNTVPLRLQHPRPVEIAVRLMADHGMPLDEALDRATMRFHAEEGTAEAGKISDVIGKDAFDEAQRVAADGGTAEFVGRAASPDLAQPAPGIGQSRTATEAQARPDGEYAPGDSAAQGGGAADGKTIGSEDAAPGEERAQSRDEPASAAAEGQGRAERLTLSDGDAIVENPPHHGTPERLVPLWQPFPIDQNSLGALASAAGRPELAAPVNPSDAAFPDPAPIDPAPRHRRFAPSLGEYGISEDDPSAANLWKLPPGSLIKAVHDFVVYVGDINAGRKHLPQTFDPNVDDPAVDEAIRQAWTAATLSTIGPGAKFRPPRGTIAPVPPRQILEASEQGEAIPRTAPQPPARPPDKAAAQSDRITSEARESGPSDSNALSADVPNSRAGKDLPPSAATEGAKSRIPAEDSIAARADQLAPRDEIGTQPPARPPDNAAARSETMASEARESGPFDSGARRADAPLERADRSLKPRREQKPADDGLSGDGDTQVDLVDVAKSAGAAKARGGAYVLRDRGDAVVRSGRTGNLAAREGQHRRDRALPEHRFDPVYRTDSYLEQRGLEQILHDRYDPPLNKIRPISPSNKNIDTYMNEARKHLREHDEK